MKAPRLAASDMVAGKYQIRTLLHDDGAISSYFAADSTGREVALKLYAPEVGQRPDVTAALQKVHAQLATLPPEQVIHVIDAGVDTARGNALFTATDRVGYFAVPRLNPTSACSTLKILARSIDAAHAVGLFHHALKPTNVLVDGESPRVVRLMDFGMNLARAAAPTDEAFAHAAPWMAPEQVDGAPVGSTADVFGAALVAFYMLTGASFWRSLTPQGLDAARFQQELKTQRGSTLQRASELGVTLPGGLEEVFARALAVSPQLRFTTVSAFAEAFERAIATPSQPPGPMKLAAPAAGGNRFKSTQYAADPEPVKPAANKFKSTQYAPDPQAEMKKAAPFVGEATLPAADDGRMPPVPGVPAHLAGPAIPGPIIPSSQNWPPPAAPPSMRPGPPGPPMGAVSVPPPPPKSSKAPLIIVLLLIVLGGGGAAAYFLFLRGEPKDESTTASNDKNDKSDKSDKSDKKDDDKDESSKKTKDDDKAESSKKTKDDDKKPGKDDDAKPAKDDDKKPGKDDDAPATSASAAIVDPPPKDGVEITVQCNPVCDAVTVDGKSLADPTKAAMLSPGSHTVVASKVGYKPSTDTFTVKAKTPMTRVYTLVAAPVVAPKPSASVKPPCGKFLKKCD